jgi:sulfate permease, SulP family
MHVQLDDILPFVPWVRRYKLRHFRADAFAGLTVAVVALPQSMAYALIAGLPVQYGLYASIIPTIIGCLWGSSAQLITGPTTTASLLVFSALSAIAVPGSPPYIQLALLLAAMAGLIRLAMGFARLGALLNFVSHSVLLGFTAGAAVLIVFKQLPGLMGVPLSQGASFVQSIVELLGRLHQVEPVTLMLGLVTIAVTLAFNRWRPNWPGTLVAMVLVGAVVAIFDLGGHPVRVVGVIAGDLPLLSAPGWAALDHVGRLAPAALAIAILGLMEAISIAQTIADQTRQHLNVNREFIGQGLANLGAAVFSGYPCSGSFTRSALNFRSGAKTPMSGIISGLAVAAAVLLAGPLAAKLPLSALAGVLIVVAYQLIRVDDIVRTLKATRSDAAVMVVTFLVTVLINIEFSIYVGVLLSIGLHLAKTSHPRIYSVVPDLQTGKMVGFAQGRTCCQMDIIQIEGSLFFGSAAYILEDLQRRMRHHPNVANLLIRMHHVNIFDAGGVHIIEIILDDIRRRDGGIFFSGVNHRVFSVLNNSGLIKDIGHTHVRTTTHAAIRRAMRDAFCPAICAGCTAAIFTECADLKQGHWDIFGEGVQPRVCRVSSDGATPLTAAKGAVDLSGKEK